MTAVALRNSSAVDGFRGEHGSRVHDPTTEEWFATVSAVPVIDQGVVHDRYAAGGLSPDSDLVWIASKGSNVLRYPLEGQSLVSKTEIGASIVLELLSG
ncbi:unnamed protein product [Clonostachys solani]|uniref:Uncharacterized protein n=1 Tax=Clonostachys solani TaxID=160281 RepID=A0A9N9W707_9HYPO|nr:unnamed protein product [Clonostachys solani]